MNYRALKLGREAFRKGAKLSDNPYSREYDKRLWASAFIQELQVHSHPRDARMAPTGGNEDDIRSS